MTAGYFNYSWCERAKEKTWKRFGGQFSTPQTKRVYPETGLLGYKVLIDGYNNTFEVPPEQFRSPHSRSASRPDISTGFSEEDREKILRTKNFMQSFQSDDRRRFKQLIASHHIGQSSIPLSSDIIFNNRKHSVMIPHPPSSNVPIRKSIHKNIFHLFLFIRFKNTPINC